MKPASPITTPAMTLVLLGDDALARGWSVGISRKVVVVGVGKLVQEPQVCTYDGPISARIF